MIAKDRLVCTHVFIHNTQLFGLNIKVNGLKFWTQLLKSYQFDDSHISCQESKQWKTWSDCSLGSGVDTVFLGFVCLFCCFTSQVNSYGHGGTVSSPNHTFSWASLNKQLTSTSCTYFRLLLTTNLLEWFSGREENDRRNYFMINLHKSMGPGRDRTRDPWICNQTSISCQTRYRLRYAAWYPRLCVWLLVNKILEHLPFTSYICYTSFWCIKIFDLEQHQTLSRVLRILFLDSMPLSGSFCRNNHFST